MTDTVEVRLGGVELGDLPVLDKDEIEDANGNPLSHPLALASRGDELRLFYRDFRALNRDNSAYEISLGSVIAASAVIFSVPLVAAPSTVSILLLLSQEGQAAQVDDDVKLVLIEPARDGDVDLAQFADAAKQAALANAASVKAVEMTPVHYEAVDANALIRLALQHQALTDVTLPVPEQEVQDLVLKLPDNLTFKEDGILYFRDIMNGEADFLFSGQQEFEDISLSLVLTNAVFYMLEEGEDIETQFDEWHSDPDALADLPSELPLTPATTGDLENVLSRLVIFSEDPLKEVTLRIDVFIGPRLVLEEELTIHSPVEEAEKAPIDDELGLPDEEFYADGDSADDPDITPDIL